MRIAFFGDGCFNRRTECEVILPIYLENTVGYRRVEFYIGVDNKFDDLVYDCLVEYKKQHPDTKIILVVSYDLDRKSYPERTECDEIIRLEAKSNEGDAMEQAFFRLRWMINHTGRSIVYPKHPFDLSYRGFSYAKSFEREIVDLRKLLPKKRQARRAVK